MADAGECCCVFLRQERQAGGIMPVQAHDAHSLPDMWFNPWGASIAARAFGRRLAV
jgi:hypothetical protein